MKLVLTALLVFSLVPAVAFAKKERKPAQSAVVTKQVTFEAYQDDKTWWDDEDFAKADAQLNAAYKLVVNFKAADKSNQKWVMEFVRDVKMSQYAWPHYRTADCYATGTTMPNMFANTGLDPIMACMTDKTTARTKELDDFYKYLKEKYGPR